ncbi:hypothetical protein AVEN_201701-1 [Araneus ventricosus]|uniref:DUF4817 domain-containing protein n=1 Tax=Araneus ventricosus TaxID=182803 RepID=A0A4Y2MTI1_ARAVE|nr:hypothetical protein AVEN_238884-1 [Araneus ventricosus]GBN29092.1 hypothetical protein AVEN_215848-1 [Araneus ventricosus]GBN29902.1 hypothetical protein AVEN_16986-1 [Araneus ventricosus]GBN29993.1 hypothetical protein AVEN_201701-1 [Araneus ventricosus]
MYAIEQRAFLVLEYHGLEHSPTTTRRSFQKRFNVPKGPDPKTIRKLFSKFERTGSVDDKRVGNVRPRQTVVTPENVSKVSGIIQQNPRNTVRRIASETGLKRSSMQKILRNSLRMFPYKIQSHQAIPIKAVRQRFGFAKEILTMIDNEGFDVGCIWFTDEAHFHFNGFVNRQNWAFWGSENPHLCEEKPLHSPKVTAWVSGTGARIDYTVIDICYVCKASSCEIRRDTSSSSWLGVKVWRSGSDLCVIHVIWPGFKILSSVAKWFLDRFKTEH